MSVKQFISAEAHLSKLGVTTEQAFDFIVQNIDQPEILFTAARQNGVTVNMLSEITNISDSVIREYFLFAELNVSKLDYTSMLINFDLASLEVLVDFNHNSGILSNEALRDAVRPLLTEPLFYGPTFGAVFSHIQPNDGIYDAEELGVGHLVNVSATDESVESLFYGSLINIFLMLDESELDAINTFPNEGDPEELQALVFNTLSAPPVTVIWTDEQLAELVVDEAVNIIDSYWGGQLVGVLDHSLLGLAVA